MKPITKMNKYKDCWKPQKLPISNVIENDYHLLRNALPTNIERNRVEGGVDKTKHFYVLEALKMIQEGAIIPKESTMPAQAVIKYCKNIKGIVFENGILSQDECGFIDLIWAAIMAHQNTTKPILMYYNEEGIGPDILDGSHRLVRAMIDETSVEVLTISKTDSLKFFR